MSDERDFYTDDKPFRDLAMNWEMASRLCFADDDFYKRPVKDTHPFVREKALDWYDEEDKVLTYFYAPADQVRRRMEVQGYTSERCRAVWEREYARHIARAEELVASGDYPELAKEIAEQKGLTFETWQERQSAAGVDEFMRFGGVHIFNFIDSFAALALYIDVYKPEAIWTDFTDYLDGYDPSLSIRENLDAQPVDYEFDFIEASGNVLILTEGTSDTKILSKAIRAMYPEFADMYEFLDFEEFKIEGGVSMVTKMIKAFAGVRMTQKTIGLFDNDAAGWEQKVLLDRMTNLPPSIRTMVLPDVEIGKNYPTLGPEGLRNMDINGSACSIELFLGRDALSDQNGNLRPVRWTAWNKVAGKYQGELENKHAATQHFLDAMKAGGDPSSLRAQFPEMNDLLNRIFRAFHD